MSHLFFPKQDKDGNDATATAEGSTAQKRSSCVSDVSSQRWNIYLIMGAVILIILFFIIPDFIIIWELELRKHVQNFLK